MKAPTMIPSNPPAPKRGRPRSTERTAKFQVRIAPDELEALRAAAAIEDREFSDWVRHVLRARAAATLQLVTDR
jgi:uncharacterized protein (DUF1778 family)